MVVPKARKLPSGKWFVQLRIGGKSISVTQSTEEKAVAEAMMIKSGLKQPEEKPDETTLTKAIDSYIEIRSNVLSPCTIRCYRSLQRNHMKSLMSTKISALSARSVQAAINEDAKMSSPKTVRNAFGLVAAVVAERSSLDLSRIKLPQREHNQKVILDAAQLAELFKATVGSDIEVQVLLAACLGLRRSEILAMQWDAIDLDKETITVKAAMVPNEKGKFVLKGTKTEKSYRTLSAPKYLISRLKALKHHPDGFLFHTTATTMERHLKEICEAHGLPPIGYHALRHTNASIMLSLNIPDKYAMERGGWSSNDTMKNIYQHTMTDEREMVNTTVDKYFESLMKTSTNANKKKSRPSKPREPSHDG